MKGPEEQAYAPPPVRAAREEQLQAQWTSDGTSELRPRQAGAAAPDSSWTPLRELGSTNDADRAPSAPAPKTAGPQPRRGAAPVKPGSARPGAAAPSAAKSRSSIEDDPPGLFGDDEDEYSATSPSKAQPSRAAPAPVKPAPAPGATTDEESSEGSGVETTAACAALLASLAAADTNLRVEIATALGKLGDKSARGPLERHLVDPDIRVRRAVATALVQLGHPKGETLLDIAERKPASDVLSTAKVSTAAARPKPKRTGGGMSIDGDTIKKLLVGLVGVGVIGGGIWYFMNGGGGGRARKPRKTKSSKKVSELKAPLKYVWRV